jgi:parallel beta-helix repeat protein
VKRLCLVLILLLILSFVFAFGALAVTHSTDADFSQGTFTGLGFEVGNDELKLGPAGAEPQHCLGIPQTPLPFTRSNHGMCIWNGKIYVSGGWTQNTSNISSVQMATINSNGTVESWQTLTPMPDRRINHAMSVWNGRLYVSGGHNGGFTYYNTVWSAPINPDGTIGAWETLNPLPDTCASHRMSAWNGRLYITGGYNGTYQKTVWMAPINPNGTIGSWTTLTEMPNPRYNHAMSVWNGRIYITQDNQVWMAPINPNGTIGSWTTNLTPMPVPGGSRQNHDMSVWNGRLYVSGGSAGGTLSECYMALINPDGTIGSWTYLGPVLGGLEGHGQDVWNGRLYTTGGYTNGVGYLNQVLMDPLNSDGTVTSWNSVTSLPAKRGRPAMSAWNGRLYVAGGIDGSGYDTSSVWKSDVNADGTLGSWSSLTGLPSAVDEHCMDVWNGRLYVTGGYKFTGTNTWFSTVESALINSNGTIGAWSQYTAMPAQREKHAMSIWNGNIYVSGGWDNTWMPVNTVWKAPIISDGTVGTWSTLTALPAVCSDHAMCAWNGKLYISGGVTTVASNEIWMATINSDGTIGSWSNLTSMPATRSRHTMNVWNGSLYVAGGMDWTNTVWTAPINSNGTIGSWSSLQVLPTSNRAEHGMAVWNGRLYIAGGTSGGGNTEMDTVIASAPLLYSATGTYYSPLVDKGNVGQVRASWNADIPSGTGMKVSVATAAATNENLSTWTPVSNSSIISNVRYLNYRITMEADSSRQNSPKLFDISFTPLYPPDAPSSFIGTVESASSIRWSWADVSNEDGYYLQDDAYDVKGATAADVTSTLESGLLPNIQYTRHVTAYNSDGSAESGSDSRYTWAATPGISSFSNISAKNIRATWTANGNPGYGATQYQCENSTNHTTSEWTTASSWDSTGLSRNTSYTFRVKARNSDLVETDWTSLGSAATTNIWYVDSSATGPGSGSPLNPFKTIVSAETAAANGDEIHVKQGTYLQAIAWTDSINLKSGVYLKGGYTSDWSTQEADPSKTIIDGGHLSRCLNASDLTATTTVEDFTIQHGYVIGNGGGFEISNSSSWLTVSNCTFTSNETSSNTGGGMRITSSSPTIINCTFASNESAFGAGIYIAGGSPIISNCTFNSNSVIPGGAGGGIYNGNTSSPIISNCIFTLNSGSTGGGGMYNYYSTPTISNCTIDSNSAPGGGGGIWNENATPTLSNCTFNNNSAGNNGGAGIYNRQNSNTTISNCVFTSNHSPTAVGGGICNEGGTVTISNCAFASNESTGSYGGAVYNSATMTIKNSILYGNLGNNIYAAGGTTTVTYSCVGGGYTGTGNISSNPLFVNPPSDVHLQVGSPCIDAGTGEATSVWGLGYLQGYGTNPDGIHGDSVRVDMGYHNTGYTEATGGSSYRTKVGNIKSWTWNNAASGEPVPSGSAEAWQWRTWGPSSGRKVPSGEAKDWIWDNE